MNAAGSYFRSWHLTDTSGPSVDVRFWVSTRRRYSITSDWRSSHVRRRGKSRQHSRLAASQLLILNGLRPLHSKLSIRHRERLIYWP
jgi:hypothetical protein